MEPFGTIEQMQIADDRVCSSTEIIDIKLKPKDMDISDADVLVAVGRGLKSKSDMQLVQDLADCLGAEIAGTRPLIEAGWLDAKHQIGLSGRTVKPKLIITVGISGSVQFVSGMSGADCILAINSDKDAPIFNVAHYGFVGDLYQIVPALTEKIRKGAMEHV